MFVFEFWLSHEKVSVIISFGSVCKLVIIFNKEKNTIAMFYYPHSPGKHRLWSVSLLFRKVKKTLCFIWFLLSELSSFSLWMILWFHAKVASFVLFEFFLINLYALFGCWDTEIWNFIVRWQFYCHNWDSMLWLSLFYGIPFHPICFSKLLRRLGLWISSFVFSKTKLYFGEFNDVAVQRPR